MLARKVDPGTATCVFTSPEPKAAETARVLASAWSVEVETIDGFREHERPDARMLRPEDFERRIGELFARPSEIVFGTESADAARQRFTDAVVRVIRRTVGDVVIVSHGTVIALFVADATGVEPFAFWKRQEMPGAVILSVPDQ